MAGDSICTKQNIERDLMLKSILMVWLLAHNLALTQEAYEDYLGYR